MGNVLQVFTNEKLGNIKTLTINDNIWFIGKEIAEKLGYTKLDAMYRLIDSEDMVNINPQSKEFKGFPQDGVILEENQNVFKMKLINESGLYTAIFNSILPQAKQFKRWVTNDVLPSIRKTGSYSLEDDKSKYDNIMPFTMEVTNGIQNTNYLMSNMSNYLLSSESRIQEVKNQTEYTLSNIENSTEKVINMLNIRKRQLVVINKQLKTRLSFLLGKEITAKDTIYKSVSSKILLDYNALIWEDISTNEFTNICDKIKSITLSDLESLEKLIKPSKSNIKEIKVKQSKLLGVRTIKTNHGDVIINEYVDGEYIICTECNESKKLTTEFHTAKTKLGYARRCKSCYSEYYKRNREYFIEYRQARYDSIKN